MTRTRISKLVAGAVLATAALGAASVAQAHTDVFLSVGLPARPVYVEPARAYVPPQPVYVRPQPVYVQPRPVVVAPPAYVVEGPWRHGYESRWERERAWRHAEWQRREWERREWERRHHLERFGSGRRDHD